MKPTELQAAQKALDDLFSRWWEWRAAGLAREDHEKTRPRLIKGDALDLTLAVSLANAITEHDEERFRLNGEYARATGSLKCASAKVIDLLRLIEPARIRYNGYVISKTRVLEYGGEYPAIQIAGETGGSEILPALVNF